MINKISKGIEDQNGQAALAIALIVTSLLLFVGLSLVNTTLKQTKITRNAYRSMQAYYLADAGTERLLYENRVAGTIDPTENLASNPLLLADMNVDFDGDGDSDGSFNITRIAPSPLNIRIIGVYKNTARAVELLW